MKIKKIILLAGSILVCEIAGVIGSIYTTPSIPGWYAGLIKSPLTPPSWVFAPVWILLYALMGIALFLVIQKWNREKNVKLACFVFCIQLISNVIWSILFFGKQDPGSAFMGIIFLWYAIIATMISFGKISKSATWLLVPYLVWVTFAGYLNFFIWVFN